MNTWVNESRFANLIISIINFLRASFADSKIMEFISTCYPSFSKFISKSVSSSVSLKAVKSFSKRFYPRRVWSAIDETNVLLRNSRVNIVGIFNPIFIFPVVYLAFIAISSYALSILALFSVLLGISFFAFGVVLSRRVDFGEIFLDEHSEPIAASFIAIGTLFIILDLNWAKGVPLFEPVARRHLNVQYTMLASLIVPGSILLVSSIGRRMEDRAISMGEARVLCLITMFVTTFLISLLGYRTQIIVSLVGNVAAMYFMNIIGMVEILASFFSAIFAISFFGYTRALSEGSQIGIFEVIGQRVGLTLSVYDTLVQRFWLFGANRGSTMLATFSSFLPLVPGPSLGPRTIVARMLGIEKNISVTSTLLGTIVLDFGLPGIAGFMLLFGIVIGLAYKALTVTRRALATAIYSLLIAYALVGIETGLVDFNVAMFFFVSLFILLKSRK